MNTVYPNKGGGKKTNGPRAPSQRAFPLENYALVDIGNGFWGFVHGRNTQLTRDVPTTFIVVGNSAVNLPVEIFNAGTDFILSY